MLFSWHMYVINFVARSELLGSYHGNRYGCLHTQTEHYIPTVHALRVNDPGFKLCTSSCQMFIAIGFDDQMWAKT